MEIPYGYCHCGCGQKTNLHTYEQSGKVYSYPYKYLRGHQQRFYLKEKSHRWKGGKSFNSQGGIWIYNPNHPRAIHGKYVPEHILIAEKVLGKFLPKGAVIHHINHDSNDNRKENLVICQDQAYHASLHYKENNLNGKPNLKRGR